MLSAAMLRIPWIITFCYILVDRFHYKIHTCPTIFDPDQYYALDSVKTSSAECINALIKRSLYHMRFLKGTSLVRFLNIRFAMLNLVAKYYETYKKTDIEDADLESFFRSKNTVCDCQACRWVADKEKASSAPNGA